MRRKLAAIVVLGSRDLARGRTSTAAGTSMSRCMKDVDVRGGRAGCRTLAVDRQGSIWTLPATGGTAKRITTSSTTPASLPFSPTASDFLFRLP